MEGGISRKELSKILGVPEDCSGPHPDHVRIRVINSHMTCCIKNTSPTPADRVHYFISLIHMGMSNNGCAPQQFCLHACRTNR